MDAPRYLYSPGGHCSGSDVLTALSRALFCTALQPSQSPDADTVREAVLHRLGTDFNGACEAQVSQAAQTDRERFQSRMSWCRQMVLLAFYAPRPHAPRPKPS
jgi:hypothetical protein